MNPVPYTGPVCYVGHDHEAADGRILKGGWHYSAVVDEEAKQAAVSAAEANVAMWKTRTKRWTLGPLARRMQREAENVLTLVEEASFEIPGEKLSLDPKTGGYMLAGDGARSHHEQHHKRLVLIAPDGDIGQPRTDEEFNAVHRHLDALEKRISKRALDAHEHGHLNTTKQEIEVLRSRLKKAKP